MKSDVSAPERLRMGGIRNVPLYGQKINDPVTPIFGKSIINIKSLSQASERRAHRDELKERMKALSFNLKDVTNTMKEHDQAAVKLANAMQAIMFKLGKSNMGSQEMHRFESAFSAYLNQIFSIPKNTCEIGNGPQKEKIRSPEHIFKNELANLSFPPVHEDDHCVREEPYSSRTATHMDEYACDDTPSKPNQTTIVKSGCRLPYQSTDVSRGMRSSHPPEVGIEETTDIEIKDSDFGKMSDISNRRKMPAKAGNRIGEKNTTTGRKKGTLAKRVFHRKSKKSMQRRSSKPLSAPSSDNGSPPAVTNSSCDSAKQKAERVSYAVDDEADSQRTVDNVSDVDDCSSTADAPTSTSILSLIRTINHFPHSVWTGFFWFIMTVIALISTLYVLRFASVVTEIASVPFEDCHLANELCQREDECCFEACNMTQARFFWSRIFGSPRRH